ncbi:hypothetical protein ACIQXA_32420 [Streptomyces massasporeus]|uniref:hypothetical protein n=1 Tax=Streptomyces massasporeus TaxID=67324 RepID=UPI003810E3E9
MDQGIAGVIAGAAGLIGAGIGGLATAYGARIGAQKTIEAAQTQVDRQSAAEHLHWVRDQRRQVYSQVVELHATYMLATIACAVTLGSGQHMSDEELRSVRGQYIKLVEVSARSDLWGPGEVVEKVNRLHHAAGTKYTALLDWSRAIKEGRAEDVARHSDEFEIASSTDRDARNAFVSAVHDALASSS